MRQGIYLLFDKMPLKSPLKIHSKLGYTRVLELLLKVRFVMLRQTKKSLFCRATSYKIGTNLKIRGRLIFCDTADLLKFVCTPSNIRDTATFDL